MIKKTEQSPTEPHVLTSWKEIAAYLGKGVRTVQRWESDLGLPVRRPYGVEKHVIVALPEELDKWTRTQMRPRTHGGGDSERPPIRRAGDSSDAIHTAHAEKLERMHALMRVMQQRATDLNRLCADLLRRTSELKRGKVDPEHLRTPQAESTRGPRIIARNGGRKTRMERP
jgi:hypothetical protein